MLVGTQVLQGLELLRGINGRFFPIGNQVNALIFRHRILAYDTSR